MFGKPRAARADRKFAGYYAEPKIDGFRAQIDYINPEQFIVYGRKNDYSPHLAGRIVLPTPGIYDAEIIVDGSLQGTASVLTRRVRCPIESLEVCVFDALQLDDIPMAGISYQNRRACLEALTWADPVRLLEATAVRKRQSIEDIAMPYIEQGYEGVVLKGATSGYGVDWHKYKVTASDEFLVVGWKFGNGEWSHTVGTIELEHCATGQNVGWCSAGSKANRQWLTDRLTEAVSTRALGIIVEVGYQQHTQDNKLRNSRLLRIRHDLIGVPA